MVPLQGAAQPKNFFPFAYGAYRAFVFVGLPTGPGRAAGMTLRYHLFGYRGSESAGALEVGWILRNRNQSRIGSREGPGLGVL